MRSTTVPIHGIPFMRGVVGLALVGTGWLGGCFSPGPDMTDTSTSASATGMATTDAATVTGTTTGATASEATTTPSATTGSTSTATTMGSSTSEPTTSTDGSTSGSTSGTTTGTTTGSDGSTGTTGLVSSCGDGIISLGEECDDGNLAPDDGCNALCMAEDYLVVFVSSQPYSGKLMGGTDVGDSNCNALVMGTTLASRTFVAWLSSVDTNARDRIGTSLLPYRLVDGKTTVAINTVDLLDGTLNAPIDHDELGAKAGAPLPVWTGTTTAGLVTGEHCSDWNAAGTGTTGSLTDKGATWTVAAPADCTALRRIYCIEKAN